MKTITHDGETYVLQTDMEQAIQNRISKIAGRANDAESRMKEMEQSMAEMKNQVATVDMLHQQITDYKSQLDSANLRYERHATITKYGLNDGELLEAVEWQFERAMKNRAKKDQQSLADWLAGCVEDPSNAPLVLRPHIQSLNQPKTKSEPGEINEPGVQSLSVEQANAPTPPPTQPPPRMNTGAIPTPTQHDDVLTRGLSDFEFYKQNREAVLSAFRKRK